MTYPRDHQFQPANLTSITDGQIVRWAKLRIYGNADADEKTTAPVRYRVYTLLLWKKAISYFMPNQQMQWNEVSLTGNPTRSALMARLVRSMRRYQTQRRGAPSQARRPLTAREYEQLIEMYWLNEDKEIALCASAAAVLQFSIIGRSDDVAKFRAADIAPYSAFPEFGITGRLPWSKNVSKERDAPV